MILYLAPGACSLADHIALHEAGVDFQRVKVDLRTHRTEDGQDYRAINPKGYVPALRLDDGQLLTENIAILAWTADHAAGVALGGPQGANGRYRLLEMLAFISTEVHKAFKPFFAGPDEPAKAKAREAIAGRLAYLAERLDAPFLLGQEFSVADAYLYVMLRWAGQQAVPVPEALTAYADRIRARPAVQLALEHEGLG